MSQEIILKIIGMHCTACAMNIDGELEDAEGVLAAHTNFAKAETKIKFEADKITVDQIKAIIKSVGYDAN